MGKDRTRPEKELIDQISSDVKKKMKSQNKGKEIMFGLGTFGIVGWSVSIPILLGIALGAYFDRKFHADFSWTLTLMFIGLITGCINAWYWVKKKSNED